MNKNKRKVSLLVDHTPDQSATLPNKIDVSTRLKYIAGLLFIISFVSQYTLLEYWNGKEKVLQDAVTGYTHAHSAATSLYNLYFTVAIATGEAENEILKKSAIEAAQGLTMLAAVSGAPKDQIEATIRDTMAKANSVKDLDSYNKHMNEDYVRKIYDDTVTYAAKIISWREIALWVYVLLYLTASVVAIVAIRFEKH